MRRHHLIVLALGSGLALGALSPAVQAQSAQRLAAYSGDALAHAETTCLEYGISPNSAAFNACVRGAALNYDRGLPLLAEEQARNASEARSTCLRYGIDPHTLGFRQCVNNEVDRGAGYAPAYVPPTTIYRVPTYQAPTYQAIVYPSARPVYMP
jgi:hypothetical protein